MNESVLEEAGRDTAVKLYNYLRQSDLARHWDALSKQLYDALATQQALHAKQAELVHTYKMGIRGAPAGSPDPGFAAMLQAMSAKLDELMADNERQVRTLMDAHENVEREYVELLESYGLSYQFLGKHADWFTRR